MGWDYVYYSLEIGSNQKFLYKHIDEFTAIDNHQMLAELSYDDRNTYLQQFNDTLCAELIAKAERTGQAQAENFIEEFKENNSEFTDGLDDDAIVTICGFKDDPLYKWLSEDSILERAMFIDYLVKNNSDNNKEMKRFLENILCE